MARKKKPQRYTADCRKYDGGCTLTVSGTLGEVMKTAIHHAVTAHGHKNTATFRKELRSMLTKAR